MNNESCPVCSSQLVTGCQTWHFICKKCGYERSNLTPAINSELSHELVNEEDRETGLRNIRANNFKKLLKIIKSIVPVKSRLLDVGCAHGWFLDAAKNDFDVLGLEPDENVFKSTANRGLPVRKGYFPEVLNDNENFDIIVFNDVIEHIPDINFILKSCNMRLNPGGVLVLNLPSSNGVFYRISRLLCGLGFAGFFERLWQKDFPSPHLHYFNRHNLVDILRKHEFNIETSGTLATLEFSGLFTRISHAGNHNIVFSYLIYFVVMLFLPILRLLPSDIIYVISTRK